MVNGRLKFYYGRDTMTCLDRKLWVCWLDRDWEEKAKDGYMLPGLHFEVSWDWLPHVFWRFHPGYKYMILGLDSYYWTGRDRELDSIRWPFSINLQRVNLG